MRALFFIYAFLSALMMWGIIASGGNANHGGSWIAALLGLVICQPWIIPLAKAFHPQGDLTALSLGLSSSINLIVFAVLAFRKSKKAVDVES
jgi:hypothetical protein